ncbi:DNA-binding protein [Salegentibacter salinarum]|uniref:DNA-binding protein n=1 Tax=Salegentibacter salinarum TaxID=447422 RepID=A0A2N0TR81_9FLAO|nr:YafY family protein [Salegentibacter salinarum]PKD17206.1 DNA-binding protein [Salegentibacter salinarum]SKB56401.1 Predicted DNA-binding transcriptional regulator YafY, contains an HTH and WYL domains [Salegentibacter salinarum]
MSFDTLKRFDRIVAILIQLQSKRIVKAQELADRFEVSLRTIYRDIRTLEASGVPIYSEAGVGYSIVDGYRLPPVMFTSKEAQSFVAAEKLMQKFTDKTLGSHYESAMFKLKSVLRGSEKDMVSAIESKVFINPSEELFNENVPDALEILFESIAEKHQVFLLYHSQDSEIPTERKIEPVGIFHENRHWYVTGFCHLRKDYRLFRTDRIQKITRTETLFQQEHPPLDHFLKNHTSTHNTKIRILVAKEVVKYIKSERNYYGFISEKICGNQVEMTFMSRDLEDGFPRWYLMFGDYAKILEPEGLKIRVKEILKNTEKGIE